MIIVPRRNLYLPERKWGVRKFQRGIIMATMVRGRVPAVVTLSGASISTTGSGQQVQALDFRADGTLFDVATGEADAQLSSGTDWIIPNTEGDSTYEVGYIDRTGDPFSTEAATSGNWANLGANRFWNVIDNDPLVMNSTSTTATFRIRKDGGAVIDSASYTIIANRTS